jgi:hypothetical protein
VANAPPQVSPGPPPGAAAPETHPGTPGAATPQAPPGEPGAPPTTDPEA